MSSFSRRIKAVARVAVLRGLYRLPSSVRRRVAGPPIVLDGQELALDVQVLLRLLEMVSRRVSSPASPRRRRAEFAAVSRMLSGRTIQPVVTSELSIPVSGDTINARLYKPRGLHDGSPLLVFYHGGGFVIGDIETHDSACRFLAKHAKVLVLSVGYRLAPEHQFPTALEDCVAAFRFAHSHAGDLGADRDAIAVGGDSAGGTLAAVVSLITTRAGGPRPAFQLLLYPGTDAITRTRSKELFKDGFFMTTEEADWFIHQYARHEDDKSDALFSPLLEKDLVGLPPAYVATAGFDPLRDEGEAYAERLHQAGVPVFASRRADLVHGYANMLGIGTRSREAMFEAVNALRAGLKLPVARS